MSAARPSYRGYVAWLFLVAVWLGGPASAWAGGFLTHDLAALVPAVKQAVGPQYEVDVAGERLYAICTDCPGMRSVVVELGRQTDGTEQRVRSGATTAATLQKLCQAREPRCRLALLSIAPAVGWVAAYPLGVEAGATAVVVNGGDMARIRAITRDPEASRRLVDALLSIIRTRMVGR